MHVFVFVQETVLRVCVHAWIDVMHCIRASDVFFVFPTRKATFFQLPRCHCMVQEEPCRKVPRACWAQLIDKEEVGISEPVAEHVTNKEAEG